jgi:hypothetical protein
MVVGTALLLAIAVVDIVRGDDEAPPAGETAGQVAGTPAPTPSADPTEATSGANGGKKRRKRQAEVVTPPPAPEPPDPVGACADSDVVATPVMAPSVAGRAVLITLSLRTVEAEACTWQLGREHLAYKITDDDGSDVWSSSQCPGQVPGDSVVVWRDFTSTYRLAWNGRSSSLDCPSSMEHVGPGEYGVQVAAIGGEPSEVVPFTLVEAPETTGPTQPLGPEMPGAGSDDGADGEKQREKKRKKNRDRDRADRPDGAVEPDQT